MKIIGIDLGTKSVKAVEIDSAFSRYEVQEYHEHPIEPGVEPAQAVARLLHSLPKQPDKIVMALRTRHLTFRSLTLPTRDKKALQSGIAFELEDDLPFSIDNAVFDYSIIAQSKIGTQVHVATTLKRNVVALLQNCQNAGIDPDLVTSETWAFRSLLNRVLSTQEQDSPTLLVQIGENRTVAYVHWRGVPVLAREIAWGGADLTLAITKKYGLTLEKAEATKLDNGFVIPPNRKQQVTEEQIDFSNCLLEPIQHLISELRQVEFATKNLTHHSHTRILLSGGTSLLPGLFEVLEQALKVPVKSVKALSSIAQSGITYSDQTDSQFLLAASLALCMVGSERSAAVNFRKGEFAKQGKSREINVQNLRRPLIAAATVIFCFFSSMIFQARSYSSKIDDTNTKVEKSVRSFFGNLSSSAVHTYLSNTSTLRSQINKELTKARELSKVTGMNSKNPVNFLREISNTIPREVIVDMTEFKLGAAPSTSYLNPSESTITLTFLMTKPETADRLATLLTGKISNISKSPVQEVPGADPQSKRWKITFSGKVNEEAFGR